jgi:hypothetical protein
VSDLDHAEVQDSLLLLLDGLLDPAAERQVRSHLASCDVCAAAWDDLRQIDAALTPGVVAHALPEGTGDHLSEEALWLLADPERMLDVQSEQPHWAHVLRCRICFVGVATRRERLSLSNIPEPDVAAAAVRARSALRSGPVSVLLSWVPEGLRIVARTQGQFFDRIADATRSGPVAAPKTELRAPSTSWTLACERDPFKVSVEIIPLRNPDRLRTLVTVQGPHVDMVRLDILPSRGSASSHRLDARGQAMLGELPFMAYQFHLIDESTGQPFASIEFVTER